MLTEFYLSQHIVFFLNGPLTHCHHLVWLLVYAAIGFKVSGCQYQNLLSCSSSEVICSPYNSKKDKAAMTKKKKKAGKTSPSLNRVMRKKMIHVLGTTGGICTCIHPSTTFSSEAFCQHYIKNTCDSPHL